MATVPTRQEKTMFHEARPLDPDRSSHERPLQVSWRKSALIRADERNLWNMTDLSRARSEHQEGKSEAGMRLNRVDLVWQHRSAHNQGIPA